MRNVATPRRMRESASETLVFAPAYGIVEGVTQSATTHDGLAPTRDDATDERRESCDYCGSARLEWRKCKLICADCRQINKSCADL